MTINSSATNTTDYNPSYFSLDLEVLGSNKVATIFLEQGQDLSPFNQPDLYSGIIPLQRLSAEGHYPTLQKVLKNLDQAPLFARTAIASCQAPAGDSILGNIPLDQVDFNPLVVAQNECSAVIRLKNGNLLTINNIDSARVHQFLQAKIPHTDQLQSGKLTAHLNPGHGFIQIECESCPTQKSALGFGAGYNPATASSTIIPNKLFLSPFSSGQVWDEAESLEIAQDKNHMRVSFHLTESQALKTFQAVKAIAKSCWETSPIGKNDCIYELASNNCVDFIQKAFAATGSKGHFANYFTDEQLLNGMHKSAPLSMAPNYAFATSRGKESWIRGEIGLFASPPATPLILRNGTETNTYPSASFSNLSPDPSLGGSSVVVLAVVASITCKACKKIYRIGQKLWSLPFSQAKKPV